MSHSADLQRIDPGRDDGMREDAELKQFRDLMPPPDQWEEGFGLKAMIGAMFVGMIMTPASMYMSWSSARTSARPPSG